MMRASFENSNPSMLMVWVHTHETSVWWCLGSIVYFNFPPRQRYFILDASASWWTFLFLSSIFVLQSTTCYHPNLFCCRAAFYQFAQYLRSSSRKWSSWPVGRFYFRLSWHDSQMLLICCRGKPLTTFRERFRCSHLSFLLSWLMAQSLPLLQRLIKVFLMLWCIIWVYF